MKSQLLIMLINMLLKMFDSTLLKKFADMALDFVENYVQGTASDVDDKIVLPICQMIRDTFDIPDDD